MNPKNETKKQKSKIDPNFVKMKDLEHALSMALDELAIIQSDLKIIKSRLGL